MTELDVDDAGVGSPIVVLHGFTGSTVAMSGLTSRLSSTHRVLAVDLVGHGRSPVPTDPARYTVDAMADDVAAALQRRALGSAHLVGYSMGGRVALTLACNRPELVRSLVLIGATPGLRDPDERAERRVADAALADRIERDGLAEFVDEWMANPLFASQERLGPEALAAARDQRLDNDPLGLAASLRGGGTGAMTPLHDRLPDLRVPTTLVVGALDPKFREIAAAMDEALPHSCVVTVTDAGHAAHLEQPDAVVDAIRDRCR